MQNNKKNEVAPEVMTNLRSDYVGIPEVINQSTGIIINGKRIRSLIFTTDISIITNNNADAVLCVYPFTPHPSIIQAITSSSQIPVFAGVGGGTTKGLRSGNMSLFAEANGCLGVVINSPTPVETIRIIDEIIDIPIIMTVVSEFTDIDEKIEAGVDILNISGAARTNIIVEGIRERYPDLPIIATGGPNDESIRQTIEAGANAITYTPPSNGELFKKKMEKYRDNEEKEYYTEE